MQRTKHHFPQRLAIKSKKNNLRRARRRNGDNIMKKTQCNKSINEKTPKSLDPAQVMDGIKSRKQEIEENVDAILSYEDRADFGIGYRKGARELVAFNIPKRR